jgi:pimeloyl-ACP methyl ester carboxylesterase
MKLKEQGIRFGKAGHLAGTMTLAEPPTVVGLVLPSAGLLHRIGPHRMHVRLARLAASRGVSSIRFDMPGIGDSDAAPGRAPYAEQELQASRTATDVLEQAAGCRRFILAGLCSGADSACNAALHDSRACALFLMEPHFYPGPLSAPLRILRRLREYGLLRAAGRIRQRVAGGALAGPRQDGEQDGEQDREHPPARQFVDELATLEARGVHLRLLYAGSNMGMLDLRRHRRRVFGKLASSSRFAIELLPRADHLFTPAGEMRMVEQRFLALLDMLVCAGAAPSERDTTVSEVSEVPEVSASAPAAVNQAARA